MVFYIAVMVIVQVIVGLVSYHIPSNSGTSPDVDGNTVTTIRQSIQVLPVKILYF
ncbi:putative membrane protein [Klebsiella phage Muenster]|nr:putative membrane protein [Klebsiella phage Muenster]